MKITTTTAVEHRTACQDHVYALPVQSDMMLVPGASTCCTGCTSSSCCCGAITGQNN
ncbi:hypothetical protein P1J78_17625 [Psychromarinibacter sp. C21-152]|uniref:Uncharacterized protein n=1 Tax=Psychromarinibacter sediminicola TaxID=3033385 RepID=A0AAE3NUX1_9RHOB|nr:hypothetical protein [Psychromarinibacter sediminicola]MDF0602562.1 hypothetical protein [Psychromarinibacter sediminicola]